MARRRRRTRSWGSWATCGLHSDSARDSPVTMSPSTSSSRSPCCGGWQDGARRRCGGHASTVPQSRPKLSRISRDRCRSGTNGRDERLRTDHIVPDVVEGEVFVHVIGASVWTDERPADGGWRTHVVGVLGGAVWHAVDVPTGEDPSDGAAVDLYGYHGRAGRGRLAGRRTGRAARRVGSHPPFCGRCGTPTEPAPGERAMRCPSCGLSAFPRLAPAMITLVTRGEDGPDQEALLARGVLWKVPMYSCLAGFVEPGESLEGAVVREVKEEVGVTRRRRPLPGQPAVAVPAQPDVRLPRPPRVRRHRARPDRDRRRQLVPPRRAAADPAAASRSPAS